MIRRPLPRTKRRAENTGPVFYLVAWARSERAEHVGWFLEWFLDLLDRQTQAIGRPYP